MTLSVRTALAGAGLALGLLAAGAASAATKSPAMQACSDQWAQMKADDTVPAGQKWPQFWSQCAKDYAAANPTDATAAADKTAPPPEEPAPAKGKSPAMAACSDDWAKMKADGKVPAGQTWPKFWSQCSKDYAASHPDMAAPAKEAKAAPAKPAPAAEDTASAKGKSPAMAACSDDWAKMKADGKVPAGQTWPKFWSQCSKDYAASNAEAAAPAKDMKAAPAKPAPAADDTASAKGKSPAMAACSDLWAKQKADGKIKSGQTWPKFWSQCSKDYAAGKIDDEELGAPLPAPDVAAKVDPNKPAVAGKREPTPGQKAAWARMRACGAEWQAAKKAKKLPAGAKWPQYWSDCNKRLKAKGQ